MGSYSTALDCGDYLTDSQFTKFDITELVKGWKNNTYSAQAGFILINDDETAYKQMFSCEHTATNCRPYVTMEYAEPGSGGGTTIGAATPLTENAWEDVAIGYEDEKHYYSFVPESTGFYTFESSDSIGDPYAALYNTSSQLLIEKDNGQDLNFIIYYHLIAGTTYYLEVSAHGETQYYFSVSQPSSYFYPDYIYLVSGNSVAVSTDVAYESHIIRFVPAVTSEYLFFTQRESGNPQLWIYNDDRQLLASNDNDAGSLNARLAVTLQAGAVYYIVAGHYSNRTGDYPVISAMDANMDNGIYFIKNVGSGYYVDIHGPSEQYWVHQWTYHGDLHEEWSIRRRTDGYYTIQSLYESERYLGVNTNAIGTNNVVLFDTITDNSLWKIFINSSGYYIFEPKIAAGKILYTPNGTLGTELQLCYLGKSDAGKNDRWRPNDVQYSYAVTHYFDGAYNVRFANASESIADYHLVCAEIFLTLFDVGITSNIYEYVSCADECTGTPVTLEDTTTACSDWHLLSNHKSRDEIRLDLITQFETGTDIKSLVAWTGHVLESRSSNSSNLTNSIVMTIGMVTDENNNYANLSNDTIRSERIYTLLHELSHQLGAPDHYCYDINSDNCTNPTGDCWRCDRGLEQPPECVMTARMGNLAELLEQEQLDGIYCDQCMSDIHEKSIFTHLEDHHN